jgi:hypothetical protein
LERDSREFVEFFEFNGFFGDFWKKRSLSWTTFLAGFEPGTLEVFKTLTYFYISWLDKNEL